MEHTEVVHEDVIIKDVEQLATMKLDSVDEEERMVRCGVQKQL